MTLEEAYAECQTSFNEWSIAPVNSLAEAEARKRWTDSKDLYLMLLKTPTQQLCHVAKFLNEGKEL